MQSSSSARQALQSSTGYLPRHTPRIRLEGDPLKPHQVPRGVIDRRNPFQERTSRRIPDRWYSRSYCCSPDAEPHEIDRLTALLIRLAGQANLLICIASAVRSLQTTAMLMENLLIAGAWKMCSFSIQGSSKPYSQDSVSRKPFPVLEGIKAMLGE